MIFEPWLQSVEYNIIRSGKKIPKLHLLLIITVLFAPVKTGAFLSTTQQQQSHTFLRYPRVIGLCLSW